MPVVSEPITGVTHAYSHGFFSRIPTLYLILSGFVLLCITIFIRRKRSSTTKLQYHFPPSRPSTPLLEKSDRNLFAAFMDETPKLDTDNLALSRTSSSSFDFTTSPSSISSSPKTFSRLPPPPPPFTPPSPLEPLSYTPIHGGESESAPPTEILHRHRSYTKPPNPLTNTPVVNGEIISGDGWRRHTRVFGGGVCEACAESERRARGE
ncbi:uncharacterized protein EAF01_009453 [Botrytis porri]|uniref:Uncharacterized protein n=1 Tax=Botrytis porri TaxID=87229 RepID=A0A4Z1KT65_9HELO|nr:uncharacterized protein EAF01_009453 [Botrytis porri]KAF7895491.1 hypothetical protein EAF01_009453 [Botrytis porri]TGO86975.1 hypothetical protein BPOR_0262g00060 [Botrytis porri]